MKRFIPAVTLVLAGCCICSGEVALQTGGPEGTAAQLAAGPAAPGPAGSECAPQKTTLLFTQRAESATITPVDPASLDVELVMHNVGLVTTFFSNTPDRLAGRLTTKKFVDYWAANETEWIPNAALIGLGPLGYDRTLILTLKSPPVFNAADRSLIYNASVILKNTSALDDGSESPTSDIVNNIARATQSFLINLKESGGKLPTFNMTEIQLFIDNVGGCVGYNGRWVSSGVCGSTGYYGPNVHVCAGVHGRWVGGYWCT